MSVIMGEFLCQHCHGSEFKLLLKKEDGLLSHVLRCKKCRDTHSLETLNNKLNTMVYRAHRKGE